MVRTVVVGLDGLHESRAAAEWAAREATLRGAPLRIVHVWEPMPEPLAQAHLLGKETEAHWRERIPREAADSIKLHHPGLDVTLEQISGRAGEVLPQAAEGAEMLVLGSRGMSGVGGFLIGAVGQAVIAHTDVPVVLVRAGEQATDEHEPDPGGVPSAATGFRPVVVGVDLDGSPDTVLAFAFEEANRRGTGLEAVHGWSFPPYYVYGLVADPEWHAELVRQEAARLTEALKPWQQKYPSVDVIPHSRLGSADEHLVDAARAASLVVVGRRIRRHPFGVHLGPVTHAVLHHATAPVAVVAHD
ncbi:universal stress protein [Streptomyces griseosporeus]|uniref:universal stress protein n=1 Tax=Streptomyces griseosporeus TaxID=1910 RepID=UPI00167EEF0F|nr:universal stress protein [Streptomyces griseosporeus]